MKISIYKTIWKHIDTNFHVLNDYNISVKFQKNSIYSCEFTIFESLKVSKN